MTDSENDWSVAENGVTRGPFSRQQVDDLIRKGKIGPAALVWRPSLSEWRPIGEHFTLPKRNMGAVVILVLVVSTCMFWAAFGVTAYFMSSQDFSQLPSQWASAIWRAIGWSLIVCGAVAGYLWLRLAAAVRSRAPETANMLSIAAFVVALAGTVAAFLELRLAPVVDAIAPYRGASPLKIETGDDGVIRIRGSITPGFASTLQDRLARMQGPVTVEIHSPGGLITEATKAAHALQARDATVIARGFCASACVIVLMGGRQRLADFDMDVDFHATRYLLKTDDRFLNWAQHNEDQSADAYLRERGVPAEYLERANKLGPDKLFVVSAVELADRGVLTGLVDGDQSVSVAEARLRIGARADESVRSAN